MRVPTLWRSFCLLALSATLIPWSTSAAPPAPAVSELASKLPSTEGSLESLSEYQGSVVLVHFFASWCGECLIEAPSLERLHRSLKNDDFTVVGIAIDDTIEAARSLKERLGLSFPVLVDTQRALKSAFSVQGVPMSIVLNAAGSVVYFNDPATGSPTKKVMGPRAWDSDAARKSILKLLEVSDSSQMALLCMAPRVAS